MYLAGLGANPVFIRNGTAIRSARVGDTISFDVPGYQEIWLYQLQSGREQFNGVFQVPMAPYTLLPQDAGMFQSSAFELTPAKARGAMIGTTSLEVLPALQQAAPAPTAPPPPPAQTRYPDLVSGNVTGPDANFLPSGTPTHRTTTQQQTAGPVYTPGPSGGGFYDPFPQSGPYVDPGMHADGPQPSGPSEGFGPIVPYLVLGLLALAAFRR